MVCQASMTAPSTAEEDPGAAGPTIEAAGVLLPTATLVVVSALGNGSELGLYPGEGCWERPGYVVVVVVPAAAGGLVTAACTATSINTPPPMAQPPIRRC